MNTSARWQICATLLEVGRHDEHREALIERAGDEPVDLGLGADIDASGRILGNEQPPVGGEPATDDNLLLVAAGEAFDRQGGIVRPEVERGAEADRLFGLDVRRKRRESGCGRDAAGLRNRFSLTVNEGAIDSSPRSRAMRPIPWLSAAWGDERSSVSPSRAIDALMLRRAKQGAADVFLPGAAQSDEPEQFASRTSKSAGPALAPS